MKLIGATAHYLTDDLDEGPIVEQAVERVDHTYPPGQLAAAGRDMENWRWRGGPLPQRTPGVRDRQ